MNAQICRIDVPWLGEYPQEILASYLLQTIFQTVRFLTEAI